MENVEKLISEIKELNEEEALFLYDNLPDNVWCYLLKRAHIIEKRMGDKVIKLCDENLKKITRKSCQ